MDTVVRPAWPSAGYKGPSSVVDIATCTEKETERLDCWNPTLVFQYEKSRHSVENQFQMRQREELFPTKKNHVGVTKSFIWSFIRRYK